MRALCAAIAVCASLLAAAPAAAADRVERGIVQSLGPTAIVLRALDGSDVSVGLVPTTRYRLNGRAASPGEILPGFVAEAVRGTTGAAVVVRAFGAAGRTEAGVLVRRGAGALVLRRASGERRSRRPHGANGGVARREASRPPRAPAGPAARRRPRPGRHGARRPRAGGRAGVSRGGTILLVEDEEDIAAIVRAYLEREGFRVVWASRGTEGLQALEQHDVRLAILDVQLPDTDGFDLCQAIRAVSPLPVVMLTARDEEIDRVTGLELGADDYVTKPFSPRELAARVRAVLRRVEPEVDVDRLAAGDVVLDRRSRTAIVDGVDVELTAREFDLVWHLAERPGVVVTRERILERVWGLAFPGGTRTVDVHVGQVRRKLGRPELIRTVRGTGYKLVAP